MTPAARIAAAIEVLDTYLAGTPAEKALLAWARGNRYAGSKDRAAVRDHVFDALRCLRSFAALGGGDTGRQIMIGALLAHDQDPAAFFTGEGYAPPALEAGEIITRPEMDQATQLDCPDWLVAPLQEQLGEDFAAIMQAQQKRAPVFIRANLGKTTPQKLAKSLASQEIDTEACDLSPSALRVLTNPRRLVQTADFKTGAFELMDAASQYVADQVPLGDTQKVLDYCAGGGGKVLALAARQKGQYFAHDIDPDRMKDLPERAARAGVKITVLEPSDIGATDRFDVVFCDAPCSGSGAWRRAPEGKWALTAERLGALNDIQDEILAKACELVVPGGVLAYATCSMLACENQTRIAAFLADHAGWREEFSRQLSPLEGGDGFFISLLRAPD